MVSERNNKATMVGNFTAPSIQGSVSITREHPANDQKRIDLVIDADTFTLGIENKIYHWEANDFENYGSVIDSLGANRTVVKALLCLRTRHNDPQPGGGFVRYTYSELWNQVRNQLGRHLISASPKWTTYLTEFMTTTDRLAGESPEEKEVTEFFMTNLELIEQLVCDRQKLLNQINARIRSLENSINGTPDTTGHLIRRGIVGSNILASHFSIHGATIGMDLSGDLSGWALNLHQCNERPPRVMHDLAGTPAMKARFPSLRFGGDCYWLQRWDAHVSELELHEALKSGFSTLIAAADTIPASNVSGDAT